MKRTFFTIVLIFAFTSHSFSQKFKFIESDYICSLGNECDILVFKDHNVVRDIFLIKPSITFLLNSDTAFTKFNKILFVTSITSKREKFVFKGTSLRFYKGKEMFDDITINKRLLTALENVQIEELKLTSGKSLFPFGMACVMKDAD